MAATLSPFTFKWGALNAALNKIVDAINRNAPLEGDNIQLDEKGQHGVSINAVRSKNAGIGQQSEAGNGGIVGPCSLRLYDVSFMQATIVDPATCQQTFVQVLIQDPGGWTDIDADIQSPGSDHPDTFGGT